MDFAPDYKPDFEYGKKKLGKTGPNFEKLPPRKPMNKRPATANENYFDYSSSYHNSNTNLFKR